MDNQMTIKEARETIKGLGLFLLYEEDYEEYCVVDPKGPKDNEYYTTDLEDAVDTAKEIAKGKR